MVDGDVDGGNLPGSDFCSLLFFTNGRKTFDR